MDVTARDLAHLMNNFDKIPEEGIRELMAQILAPFPGIGWEMGPDPENEDKTILALTTDGNRNKLQELERQLSLPIRSSRWTIVAGSPPKLWDRYFEIVTEKNETIPIEGNAWSWRLKRIDNKAAIDLVAPNECASLGNNIWDAASILLSSELGEANLADHIEISDITYLKGSPDDYQPIAALRGKFAEWFPTAPFADFMRLRS